MLMPLTLCSELLPVLDPLNGLSKLSELIDVGQLEQLRLPAEESMG